jgi:tRNA-Thr(GGU) m(6)t(6)A37 methyltransferase TsaA
MTKNEKIIKLNPIGIVKRNGEDISLHIKEEFRPALQQLEHFSHVHVLWWANEHDNKKSRSRVDCTPPYGENPPVTGVFATRAEYRPNPIGMTIAEIIEIDHKQGIVKVVNLDAFDNTPLLDLKAYFPVCDRVKEAEVPSWITGWPEWFPEVGMGLYEE